VKETETLPTVATLLCETCFPVKGVAAKARSAEAAAVKETPRPDTQVGVTAIEGSVSSLKRRETGR